MRQEIKKQKPKQKTRKAKITKTKNNKSKNNKNKNKKKEHRKKRRKEGKRTEIYYSDSRGKTMIYFEMALRQNFRAIECDRSFCRKCELVLAQKQILNGPC